MKEIKVKLIFPAWFRLQLKTRSEDNKICKTNIEDLKKMKVMTQEMGGIMDKGLQFGYYQAH